MIISPTAQGRIEDYLNEFAARLRPLPAEQTREFVAEIRSHILDTATTEGGGVTEASAAAALARLGSASELALGYLEFAPPAFAFGESTQLPPWKSVLSQAGRRIFAVAVILASLLAYLAAGILALSALSKPFNDRVGLWKMAADDFSFHLGLTNAVAPPAGQEILGWSIIPLGLIAAAIVVGVAIKIDLRLLRLFRSGGIRVVA